MAATRPPSRLALFGGTFDPPHTGHMLVAREAFSRLKLDRVLLLPCRRSPHKPDNAPAALRHRSAMLRTLARECPWLAVDLSEARRPGPSYSYHTAEHFRARHPDAEIFWIMGSDQWNVLPTWAHPERFIRAVTPLVFPRPGPPRRLPGFSCVRLPVRVDVSSTQIRAEVKIGGDIRFLVPDPIRAYIIKHKLYT